MVKRKLILSFVGHFHLLVDDRIGSRVGDRLWAAADPYLKVRLRSFCSFVLMVRMG
jgi:nucleolar protein 9